MTNVTMKGPGDRVPQTTFRLRHGGEWEDWTSSQLFDGKTVVLFALPGAFTPTCSTSHLPGFKSHAAVLKQAGVDRIYCLSVNDTFVTNAWADNLGVADEVVMLRDGARRSRAPWVCWWRNPIWGSAPARGAIPCWWKTV